jgi:transmembrane sensor
MTPINATDYPGPDDATLAAYYAERCTPEESDLIERWRDASPANAVSLEAGRRVWIQAAGSRVAVDTARMLDRFRAAVDGEAVSSVGGVGRRLWGKGMLRQWTGYAVATTGAILSIALAAFVHGRMTVPTAPHAVQRYSTTAGQRATVTLANGTEVLLGPATTLAVNPSVSNTGMTVVLTGQARFTVTPHSGALFLVRTGNAVARVLGTRFFLRRYATDRTSRVTVTDGRVSLHSSQSATLPDSGVVLTAHTFGVVDDSGRIHVTPNLIVADDTAWTTGRLVFRNTPARDVLLDVSRAYGVDIQLADSALAEYPLTWSVSMTDSSLNEVLDVLATVLHAHVVRSGRTVTLVSGQPPSSKPLLPHHPFTSELQYGR